MTRLRKEEDLEAPDPSKKADISINNSDDTKSQTSTTPSAAESGSSKASTVAVSEDDRSRRKRCMVVLLVIGMMGVALVVAGAVLSTQQNKTTESQSDADTTVVVVDVDTGRETGVDVAEEVDAPVDVGEPMAEEPTDLVNNDNNDNQQTQPPQPTNNAFPKPFGDIQLPPLNEDTLQAYASLEEWEADFTLAVKMTVNHVILQNLLHIKNSTHTIEEVATAAGVGASIASAADKQASQAKIQNIITKSHTNNREADADEADLLKTDGTYVYAAYGDYLVVWDRQGNMVAQEQMPDPSKQPSNHNEFVGGAFHDASFIYIDSIQLTDTHVLVTTGGMDNYDDDNLGYGVNGTHLRVYLKPTATSQSLTLVATQNIHGYFVDARYLEQTNSIHICTGGDFDVYSHLVEPLDVYHYPGMDQIQYYEAATRKAQEELIPHLVAAITQFFLETNRGQLPTTMKLNTWATDTDTKDETTLTFMDFAGIMDDAYRAYMQVTSVKVDALPTTPIRKENANEEAPLLLSSTTSVLAPSSWGYLYATQDSIVLNVNQYQWNSDKDESSDVVHLIQLKVDESTAATSFYGLGSLPGILPNRYSIDIQGTDMRVATTQQHWFPLDQTWEMCGDSWYFENDECMDEPTWNACFDFAMACRHVVKTGCPYTFTCLDDEKGTPEPSTENRVSVFDIGQPGIMKERGSVTIGEAHDTITAIHFGETFSYAATYDQRGPFYILNLAEGQAPAISGTLKLNGFSSYLQPLNDDSSLLVGVGQSVTGTGNAQQNTGLVVTVFDVSNTAKPVAVASILLEDLSDESRTSSDAEVNHRAIQYSKGRLIIPLSIKHKTFDDLNIMTTTETTPTVPLQHDNENFEGFVVLDVRSAAMDGIQEILRINHVSPPGHRCHNCAGFNNFKRSFLFEDNDSLMTIHDNLVVSTDLVTGARQWAFNMTIEGEDMSCCY